MSEVLYRVDRHDADGDIEVYGDPSAGWYEWRVVVRGEVIEDSGRCGRYGTQYGSPALALRDALNNDEDEIIVPATYRADADAQRQHEAQVWNLSGALGDLAGALERAAATATHHLQGVEGDAEVEAYYRERIASFNKLESILRQTMDWLDGMPPIPGPDSLSDEFKCEVATWNYKGNLRGGIHVIKDVSGAIHPMVADYGDFERMYSGGLYDTWAEAYAAIGAALDEQAGKA